MTHLFAIAFADCMRPLADHYNTVSYDAKVTTLQPLLRESLHDEDRFLIFLTVATVAFGRELRAYLHTEVPTDCRCALFSRFERAGVDNLEHMRELLLVST